MTTIATGSGSTARSLADYLIEDQAAFERDLERCVFASGFDLDAYECFRARALRHIDIEETLLLTTSRLPLTWQLRVEHKALALLLAAPPSRRLVGEIRQLLLLHMGAEMGPGGALDRHTATVPPDEQARLARRASTHPFPRDGVDRKLDGLPRTAAAALREAQRRMTLPALINAIARPSSSPSDGTMPSPRRAAMPE